MVICATTRHGVVTGDSNQVGDRRSNFAGGGLDGGPVRKQLRGGGGVKTCDLAAPAGVATYHPSAVRRTEMGQRGGNLQQADEAIEVELVLPRRVEIIETASRASALGSVPRKSLVAAAPLRQTGRR